MPRSLHFWAATVLLLTATLGLGYFTQRTDFQSVIAFYCIFFIGYFWATQLVRRPEQTALVLPFLVVAMGLRGVLLFATPTLSDDFYRFIWDGRLWWSGINPFDHLPSELLKDGLPPLLSQSLYENLNSPSYFTIYPPVMQAIFVVATGLFPKSILGSVLVMRAFLCFFEAGSLWLMVKLLKRWELAAHSVLWYALNPLIIIELVGNLHFEAGMIFFWLVFLTLWNSHRYGQAAVALALSVATKLLPLIVLPFLLRRLPFRTFLQFLFVFGAVLLLLFMPLVSGFFFQNFGESLNLYFQKFEFNASLYYVLRWVGFQWAGYNLIAQFGPALAVVAGFAIFGIAFKDGRKTAQTLSLQGLWAMSLYLLCTTTVHPWYLSFPLALSVFTPFRYVVAWSGLIFLTYWSYRSIPYAENLAIVAIEYAIVMVIFWVEWRRYNSISNRTTN